MSEHRADWDRGTIKTQTRMRVAKFCVCGAQMPCPVEAAEREAGELRERNATLTKEFTQLARHHRDCEMLAEQMAQLLGHVQQGHKPPDLGLRIQHIIGSWEAHQWPEIEARAALSTGEDQSAG